MIAKSRTLPDALIYSLTCKEAPWLGSGVLETFSHQSLRLRLSKKLQGGFWEGSFWIPFADPEIGHNNAAVARRGYARATRYMVEDWYEKRLGCRIEQHIGGTLAWQGIVWSMELTLDGAKERVDYGEIYNRIKALGTDENGEDLETDWYENLTSQARWGIRELIIPADDIPLAEAQTRAQTELTRRASPVSTAVAFDRNMPEGIEIQLAGDIFTAQNRYVSDTSADGTTGNISDFVQAIVTNDCQFLQIGRITENTVQTRRALDVPTRAWDQLMLLVAVGDANFNPWVLYIQQDGRARYEMANSDPVYEWQGKDAGLVSLVGSYSPWTAWPGVIRNTKRTPGTPLPGTFTQDRRDSWVLGFEMADGQEQPTPELDGFDPEEILRAHETNRRWLEEEEADVS